MIKNPIIILDLLDNAAELYGDKTVYECEDESITFKQVQALAKSVGTEIAKTGIVNKPVVVWSARNIITPVLFLGVQYSGNCYAPIGDDTPFDRAEIIMDSINPELVLVDGIEDDLIHKISKKYKVIKFSECKSIDENLLKRTRQNIVDTDPQMMIFTSGSTGIPKGVIASGHSLMDLIISFSEIYPINSNTIIGGQSPLYYIDHWNDIYMPLFTGCKLVIIPKQYFVVVSKLIEYLNKKKINFVAWTTSVFNIIQRFDALEDNKIDYVKTAILRGEPLKYKLVKYLVDKMPDTEFYDSYAATEMPDTVLMHKIDRTRDYDSFIPLGKAVKNRKVLLINNNKIVKNVNEVGELYIAGSSMAISYYKDCEKTKTKFVQNPLHNDYTDILYSTGDLASINKNGEYILHGRSDNRIKHMGYRIELGEIEHNASICKDSGEVACVYSSEKETIALFYTGAASVKELAIELRAKLPAFMVPRVITHLDALPLMFNGKVDIQKLKKIIEEK